MQHPRLTILTALLDFDDNLLKTFESLKSGLSSNNLKWVIKSRNPLPEHQLSLFASFKESVTFYSDKDSSLYQALNKGLEFVDTDFFLVLGSGDILFPGTASFLNNKILDHPESEGFMFAVSYNDYIFPANLDNIHYRMPSSHQGMLLKTKNVLSIGGFNQIYKYVADYDLICRYYLKYPNILTFFNVIGHNAPGGLSDLNKFEAVLELYLIGHKYWKDKFKNFEFNDIILQNLTLVNSRLKTKQQKGENMQTLQQVKQEIFSYLLNMENERKRDQEKKNNEFSSTLSDILKVLEIANQDFEKLRLEMESLKK